MNGFILLIPFMLIRFGLLAIVNKDAVKRAAHFAPMAGNEVLAYWLYQIANIGIFIYLFFLEVKVERSLPLYIGVIAYLSGLILCALSVISFAAPSEAGANFNGLYQFSRNPMYISYFICFVGCSLLTQSLILFGLILVFQITSHWIILSEERWCISQFGEEYVQYMKKVKRYI